MDLFAPRIRATIASLRAANTGLNSRIDVFNAEGNAQLEHPADDGAALGPARAELGYVFGGIPIRAGSYPYIEVAIPDAVVENLSLSQVEGDLSSSIVVACWAGRAGGEDFPTLYEKVLGYARCVTEVLLAPGAIYPSETVDRVRFAFAANPDRREREEMETFTFGGFVFFTTDGVAQRP